MNTKLLFSVLGLAVVCGTVPTLTVQAMEAPSICELALRIERLAQQASEELKERVIGPQARELYVIVAEVGGKEELDVDNSLSAIYATALILQNIVEIPPGKVARIEALVTDLAEKAEELKGALAAQLPGVTVSPHVVGLAKRAEIASFAAGNTAIYELGAFWGLGA